MNKILRPMASRQTGFSLIEVLIGAVILATGLLALSALQGSLARNAADARIRSQVAAALESVAEADRGTSSFLSVPAATGSVTVPGLGVLNITVQGCNYRNLTTGENVNTCANKGGTAKQPQYKRIVYGATWTDSVGAARSMTLTSVVSPRTIAGISPLPFSTPTQGVSGQVPVVRTPSPEVPGMIPIAIGDGSDTAATNPKPNIVSGNVVRTSFEVLTYQDQGSNIVKQQRRVETAIVGCTCTPGSGPSGAQFERSQWPAYWDGTRYTIYSPDSNATAPGAASPTSASSGATQDVLCTECCRDHHDVSGTDVKYDPYRTDPHNHYKLVGSTLTQATGSDNYLDVCRMIRVDGFWRTAQDLQSRHFGLLETENVGRSASPLSTSVASYETFVINYLRSNYLPGQSPASAASFFTGLANSPARIDISKPTPVDERYLHARGLYVDKVETAAQQKINAAAASCTRANPVECILPLLAFTSINVTEPAFWTVADTNLLTVDSDGFVAFNPTAPNRGRVNAKATALVTGESNVNSLISASNSGLASRQRGVDPEDDAKDSDQQLFRVNGIGTGTGDYFTVSLNNLGVANRSPAVQWGIGLSSPVSGGCTGSAPYRCDVTIPLAAPTTVAVSAYNQQVDIAGTLSGVSCPGRGGTYTYTTNGQDQYRVCRNYRVSSAATATATATIQDPPSNSGMVGSQSNGSGSEATTLTFSTGITSGQEVTVGFTIESNTPAPANSCTFGNGANSNDLKSVIFGTCP